MPKVKNVEPMSDYRIYIEYDNGERRVFNVTPYLNGEWFGKLKNLDAFKTVRPRGKTVEWQDGQDIAPHELYELSVPV